MIEHLRRLDLLSTQYADAYAAFASGSCPGTMVTLPSGSWTTPEVADGISSPESVAVDRYGRPVATLRNVAVVLAGGTGTRVGLNIPKQLIKIAGKPIIEHTIATMQASPLIDEIVVMMAPGYLDEVRAIVKQGRLRQGQPDPRGCRRTAGHPERHDRPGAGRARRRGLQRAAARRRPSAGLADDHQRQRRGVGDLRGRRHGDPLGRHGDPGRRRVGRAVANRG